MFFLLACSDSLMVDYEPYPAAGSDPDTASGIDTAEEALDEQWSNARLVVESPLSASFIPYGADASFVAKVYDAEGTLTDFSDIVWSSDVDTDWTVTGNDLVSNGLDVGTHSITAEAALPNGDRLASTVGGVLVQSIYAGVYVGELNINVSGEYDGQEVAVGCSGPLTLVVDAYGEVVTGEAGCLISLFGYDLDSTYNFDLQNDDGDLSGEAAIDLSWFELPVDTEGSLSEDGELEGGFTADVYGYLALDGEYTASLLTRDLSTAE
ncbi:MAG: hypothetical protein FJ102_20185 [Deltaproteobacteria bacterium]|nr:hypothetical protein [Deltaproteobacteria bacterium]